MNSLEKSKMPEHWVVNASPIIVLAKINQQDILLALADEIVVPQAVVDEINAGPTSDPARIFLASSPLPIVKVNVNPIIQAWDLGSGETAVLSYAFERKGWKAVIDDGAARRCAQALDIPMIGALGVILKARQTRLIPEAAPLLKALRDQGFRLDDRIIRQALKQLTGEEWP